MIGLYRISPPDRVIHVWSRTAYLPDLMKQLLSSTWILRSVRDRREKRVLFADTIYENRRLIHYKSRVRV